MERDDQIFIRMEPDKEPVEFLLTEQPLRMIKYGYASKDDIRRTIESTKTYIDDIYTRSIMIEDQEIFFIFDIKIDPLLKTILTVEITIM